jgi:hypothetical protein
MGERRDAQVKRLRLFPHAQIGVKTTPRIDKRRGMPIAE